MIDLCETSEENRNLLLPKFVVTFTPSLWEVRFHIFQTLNFCIAKAAHPELRFRDRFKMTVQKQKQFIINCT